MSTKEKKWLVAIVLLILVTLGIYGYRGGQKVLNEGVYSIGTITRTGIAINGIKIWEEYYYDEKKYEIVAKSDISKYSLKDVGRREFIMFLPDDPGGGIWSIPEVPVPDSLEAPDKGWTEEWMKENYPEVVKQAHDTK